MSTYQSRLLERRARFVERWRTRLSLTREAIDMLDAHRSNHEVLSGINKDFHQLAGAAGIYELQSLCNDAISAEDVCIPLLRSGRAATNEDVYSLKIFLSSIVETLLALQTGATERS